MSVFAQRTMFTHAHRNAVWNWKVNQQERPAERPQCALDRL